MSLFFRILTGITLTLGIFISQNTYAVMGDITLQRQGEVADDGTPAAVFPHWFHRVRYKCYVCHSAIFEMKAGANVIHMQDIMAGKSCGVCHNGKTAWSVSFDTCPRCHKGE